VEISRKSTGNIWPSIILRFIDVDTDARNAIAAKIVAD
jgi:hypothetical protein